MALSEQVRKRLYDDIKKAKSKAIRMISEFSDILNGHGIDLLDYHKDHTGALEEMLQFYADFLTINNQNFTSFDFYKVISWYSILLASKLCESNKEVWKPVIALAIWRMLDVTEKKCGKKISKIEEKKIVRMVILEIDTKKQVLNDRKNSDFGIGKNGLYMLMRMLTVTQDCDVIASKTPSHKQ